MGMGSQSKAKLLQTRRRCLNACPTACPPRRAVLFTHLLLARRPHPSAGDSLALIAQAFTESTAALQALNGNTDAGTVLQPGQKVLLPPFDLAACGTGERYFGVGGWGPEGAAASLQCCRPLHG